jgi:predicted transcriptional regulator of viral defense system
MTREPLLKHIRKLGRPVFTTGEIARLSGKSLSSITQSLGRLATHGLVIKASRGLWVEATRDPPDPFSLISHLLPSARVYVSFVSALHLHGMTEQISQTITLASTVHTYVKRTALAVYAIHRLSPDFFFGFDWYKGTGSFLVAAPEKAVLDCLYLAARKKRQFSDFPELSLPASFSFAKAESWAKKIRDIRLRTAVLMRLKDFHGKAKIKSR